MEDGGARCGSTSFKMATEIGRKTGNQHGARSCIWAIVDLTAELLLAAEGRRLELDTGAVALFDFSLGLAREQVAFKVRSVVCTLFLL